MAGWVEGSPSDVPKGTTGKNCPAGGACNGMTEESHGDFSLAGSDEAGFGLATSSVPTFNVESLDESGEGDPLVAESRCEGSEVLEGQEVEVDTRGCGSGTVFAEAASTGGVDYNMILYEAQMRATGTGIPKLPWERGVFARIFGNDDFHVKETMVEPLSVSLPGRMSAGGFTDDAHVVASDFAGGVPVFQHVIKFGRGWRKKHDDSMKFGKGCQTWRDIVMTNIDATDFAQHVEGDRDVEQEVYRLVKLALSGKSVSTVCKRARCMEKYWRWHAAQRFDTFLPVDVYSLVGYVEALNEQGRTSAIKELMETLTFGKYVVGLAIDDKVLKSPVLQGILRGARSTKKPKKQSRVLEVKEVAALEDFFKRRDVHSYDRYACAMVLFMIYSRARLSDLKQVSGISMDLHPERADHGYVEVATWEHKTMRSSAMHGLPLLLIAPVHGVGSTIWGLGFKQALKDVGLDIDNWKERPLFLAPTISGDLSSRAIGHDELAGLVLRLIERSGVKPGPGFTGHGLKATVLSWMAKAGFADESRLVLGHHSDNTKKTLHAYSRDAQSPALRDLERCLKDIRMGTFFPDHSRSGYFVERSEAMPEPQIHEREQTPSEHGDAVLVDDEAAEDSSSSSDSDSSSDGSSSDEAGPDGEEPQTAASSKPDKKSLDWATGCEIYLNQKTGTMHLKPRSQTVRTFICGRNLTADTNPVERETADGIRCKQCVAGRNIRDVDSMVSFMDDQRAKRPRLTDASLK